MIALLLTADPLRPASTDLASAVHATTRALARTGRRQAQARPRAAPCTWPTANREIPLSQCVKHGPTTAEEIHHNRSNAMNYSFLQPYYPRPDASRVNGV